MLGPQPGAGVSCSPELLLGSRGVQCVLQLCLQGLQLLAEVPLEFLRFGATQLLRLQVLLKLSQVGLKLSNLLESVVLLGSFLITPDWRLKEVG